MPELEGINELSDQIVICRTLGHSWDENPNAELDTMFPSEWVFALRCTRCTTERFDFTNVSGDLIQRYYRYPDKYKTHKTPRNEFRAEMIRRSLLIHQYKKRRRRSA